jgi:hypothetical protein
MEPVGGKVLGGKDFLQVEGRGRFSHAFSRVKKEREPL